MNDGYNRIDGEVVINWLIILRLPYDYSIVVKNPPIVKAKTIIHSLILTQK